MEVTPKYVSPRSMWVSKLTLRCITIVFGVIAISLAATDVYFGLVVMVAPIVVSICWCIAELICIAKRGGHRGIHPGANVGMDLVIWLGMMASTIIYGLFGPIYYPYYSYSSSRYYRIYDSQARAIALVAFGSLLIILHFTTFVIACYETNQRNKLGGQTILVMQGQGPVPGAVPSVGQMQAAPGGQVFYQVLPGANGLPQQQVYYVPVQAMPNGQFAPMQTMVSPPPPAVVAGNGVVGEQKLQGYA